MDGEQIGIMGMGAGILGLLIAFMLYRKVDSIEIENKTVATITARIQDGAMAFLMAEYRMLSIFIVVVAALLFAGGEDKNPRTYNRPTSAEVACVVVGEGPLPKHFISIYERPTLEGIGTTHELSILSEHVGHVHDSP